MRELACRRTRTVAAVLLVAMYGCAGLAPTCGAAVGPGAPTVVPRTAETQPGASSLESAAAKAGNTGRAVAMSRIGLAFAVAGTVLAFRRDFKEAAAVFAVGIIAVLLA